MEEIDYIDYYKFRESREEYKKQLAKHNLTLAYDMILPSKYNVEKLKDIKWYKPQEEK